MHYQSKSTHENILLEGLKTGNQPMFDYLFHYYYSGMVAFVVKYVNNKDVAEDIVQDFFFKLWINRSRLNIQESLKSYFFTSVKNKALDYLKHQQIKEKANKYFEKEAVVETNEDFLVESELRESIELAISKLPDKCREIFILNRLEGYSPKEIAQKKGVSIRTVEGHIGKGIKILRKELALHIPASLLILIVDKL